MIATGRPHRFALLIIATLLLGCKNHGIEIPTAPVAGKVTYQGKPLGFGRILFFHPSGHAMGADIAPDGTYTLNAYQGNNCISVECFDCDVPGSSKERGRMMGDNNSLIPYRYLSYGTSGLTFEVKPGDENKADFNLKD
jgi:hypothetical protein